MYKDNIRNKARESTIQQYFAQYKACPDNFNTYRSCFSKEQRDRLLTQAEDARSNGRWEEAAMRFLDLGRENDAREMAGRCPRDVRRRIIDELDVRRAAADRVLNPAPRK